jgi:hypothetical protein
MLKNKSKNNFQKNWLKVKDYQSKKLEAVNYVVGGWLAD